MEFIDDMYERLLVSEGKTYQEAHRDVFNANRQKQYVDIKRIENGYQLFRKRHPEALDDSFRRFIKVYCPEDWERAQKIFGWKIND